VVSDSGGVYLANAPIGSIFAASGPVAIILSVGARGGLSESDLSSWIFGAFFINGLITLLFCALYRQPLVFFWTIPGTVLVGPALSHLRWAEVMGAFLATGLLMLVLGLTGWVRRAMQAVPMPIVMGMVAGVFLRFGLGLVLAFRDDAWIAVAALALAFGLFASVFTRLMLAAPPAFIATLAGLAMLRVLQTAFNVAFRQRYTLGALVMFIVTVADVPIFTIGAPFWGLVIGYAVSRLLEAKDFGAAHA
jgi:benzoate membrane transport protein